MEIYNDLHLAYGCRKLLESDLPAVREMTLPELIRFSGISKAKIPFFANEGKRRLAERIHEVRPIAGMIPVISQLRTQYETLGILTTNSKANVEDFLAIHRLDCFDFISSVSKYSGKAKGLKAIMRTYSVSARDMIYVGDESRDMKASRKAGVRGAAVLWGLSTAKALRVQSPHWVVEKPHDLLRLAALTPASELSEQAVS